MWRKMAKSHNSCFSAGLSLRPESHDPGEPWPEPAPLWMPGWSVGYSLPKAWTKTQHPRGVWAHIMLWWPERWAQENALMCWHFQHHPSGTGANTSSCISVSTFSLGLPSRCPLFCLFFKGKSLLRHFSSSVSPRATGLWSSKPFPMAEADKWGQPVGALTHTFINWLPHIVFSWKRERKWYCLFIQWQLKGLVLERRNKNLFNKWVKIEREKKRVGCFGPALFVFQLLSQPLLPISYSFWLAELECLQPC